ncbi:MAG: DUF4089 domain-containing protein [Sulfuriferula sp.]|jgi:hypothetical protein|nr:DUF4089 domain-containing protein [Sulfuriferula sp.]
MNKEIDLQHYVEAALALQNMQVDAQRLESIIRQFTLLAAMADSFMAEPLPPALESAPLYRL